MWRVNANILPYSLPECQKNRLWETKKASLLLTFFRTSAVKGCDVVVCDLFSRPDGNCSPNLNVEIVMDDVPVTS